MQLKWTLRTHVIIWGTRERKRKQDKVKVNKPSKQLRQLSCRLPDVPAHLLPSRKIEIVLNSPVAGHSRRPGHMTGRAAVTTKLTQEQRAHRVLACYTSLAWTLSGSAALNLGF